MTCKWRPSVPGGPQSSRLISHGPPVVTQGHINIVALFLQMALLALLVLIKSAQIGPVP